MLLIWIRYEFGAHTPHLSFPGFSYKMVKRDSKDRTVIVDFKYAKKRKMDLKNETLSLTYVSYLFK